MSRDLADQDRDQNPAQEDEKIFFLDHELTPAEYQEICQNLGEYFSILKSWRKKGKSNETKKDV